MTAARQSGLCTRSGGTPDTGPDLERVIGASNVANVGVNCGRNSASERDLITVLASGGDLDTRQTVDDRSDQPRSQLSVWYTP